MSEEQLNLSKLCENMIKLYDDSDMSKEQDEETFWTSLREFLEEANKITTRYNIGNLVDNIGNIKSIIDALKRQKEEAGNRGLNEKALELHQVIGRNYLDFILVVGQVKEKAKRIEERKSPDIASGWAISFLTQYYEIIQITGIVDHSVKILEADLPRNVKEMIQADLVMQRSKLNIIANQMQYLRNLDGEFPADLKEMVSSLDTSLKTLLGVHSEQIELAVRCEKIFQSYDTFSKELRQLYDKTLRRCIV